MWQPIETAPKDGTAIIVCGSYDREGREQMLAAPARWRGDLKWMRHKGFGFSSQCHPTHWMPLPPLPMESE